MIDLYTWPTPNGHKVQIMLEEIGLPYTVHPIDITEGAQLAPEYLAINPNNKVPAIVDRDGPSGTPYTLIESGAILFYLAEKTGRFLPSETGARHAVMQWLMFQMGNLGPMMGQAQHFTQYAPAPIAYAIERYRKESARLLRVIEHRLAGQRLAGHDYLGGAYSIADIATFPWIRIHKLAGLTLDGLPELQRWYGAIRGRPAVDRGLKVLLDDWKDIATSDTAKHHLFGRPQFEER